VRTFRFLPVLFWLLSLPASLAAGEPLPLTIRHFNDFHGQLEPVTDAFRNLGTVASATHGRIRRL
jgi:2',3'-cyclic-nucleotide 2'-phosphodiesterase (5'-nucleotidase family)